MAEILGLGCTHAPMILNPPEQWVNARKGIYSRVAGYQAPPAMVQELGDDEEPRTQGDEPRRLAQEDVVGPWHVQELHPEVRRHVDVHHGGELVHVPVLEDAEDVPVRAAQKRPQNNHRYPQRQETEQTASAMNEMTASIQEVSRSGKQ